MWPLWKSCLTSRGVTTHRLRTIHLWDLPGSLCMGENVAEGSLHGHKVGKGARFFSPLQCLQYHTTMLTLTLVPWSINKEGPAYMLERMYDVLNIPLGTLHVCLHQQLLLLEGPASLYLVFLSSHCSLSMLAAQLQGVYITHEHWTADWQTHGKRVPRLTSQVVQLQSIFYSIPGAPMGLIPSHPRC